MKKHLQRALTAALTLVLLLTACGQKEADANDTPPSAQAGACMKTSSPATSP